MMDPSSGREKSDINIKRNRFKSVIRFVALLAIVILGLLILTQILLNRTWGKSQIEAILTNSLKTETTLGDFRINVFRGFSATDLLIKDHREDTLIFASALETDLSTLWLGLLHQNVSLRQINVKGGLFNLVRYEGEKRKNLSMTFNPNPGPPTGEPEAKRAFLDLHRIQLTNFEFRNHDYNRGSEEFYIVPDGSIDVENLGFDSDSLIFKNVTLDCPDIKIRIFDPEIEEVEGDLLVQDTSSIIEVEKDSTINSDPLLLQINSLRLRGGEFQLDNFARTPEWSRNYDRIDYDHFLLTEVNVDVDTFTMKGRSFSGRDFMLSLESPSGLSLTSLAAKEASVDSNQMILYGMELFTPNSAIGDTLVFKYRCYESWRNFNDKVFIQANIKESLIAFRDIMFFAPGLYDNTFFINSENEVLEIDGKLYGRINSLKANDLSLSVDRDIRFRGDVSTRDLAIRDQELVSLDINELVFDIRSLENIIPGLELPSNFEKLGDVYFNGRFDGYFLDFVTFGDLQSNLGKAKLDMRLDLKPGRDLATYSGTMSLSDFDLQTWTGQEDIGNLTMQMKVEEGQGLTLNNANASVNGIINKLEFKEYEYVDLSVDGRLTKNLFDGVLISDSEDARLTFNGRISNLDSVPEYEFKAKFEEVRLQNLNLSKKRFDFGGETEISLTGLNWDELIGQAFLENSWIVFEDQDTLNLDKIDLAQINAGNGRKLNMRTSIGTVELEGVYDIPTIHQDVIRIINENHPKLSQLVGIDSMRRDSVLKEYRIGIDLTKDFHWVDYFTNDRYRVGEFFLDGHVNTANSSLKCLTAIPMIGINSWNVSNTQLNIINEGALLVYELSADSIHIKDKAWFSDVKHVTNFSGDSGTFKINYVDPQRVFESVEITADMAPVFDQLEVRFKPSSLWFGQDEWRFVPDNSLVIGKEGLAFDDFELNSDEARLIIDDINETKGIEVSMLNFSSDIIDSLIHLKPFDFGGTFDANLTIGDLSKARDISFTLEQDSTYINNENRGSLNITAQGSSVENGINVKVALKDGDSRLMAQGQFVDQDKDGPGSYNFDVETSQLPLELLEAIIKNGISETQGGATGKLKVDGKGPNFEVVGDLLISDGSTKIDYTGVKYFFTNQNVVFDKDFIDFNDVVITDVQGNPALIYGGLGHTNFKDWDMDILISSDRMIGLNTTKQDNPDYYGYVVGEADVEFYGTFENPNIDITATTAFPSNLVIPLSSGGARVETGFVTFIKQDTTLKDTTGNRGVRLKGLELDMKLTVTEDARSSIIFDEQAGDKLEGYGRGNMQINLSRNGEMTVYGDYEIEEGDYLFTLLNFVNKPFIVKRGGTIRWTGDPVDALIDIQAEYKGLTAAPYPLIKEYLVNNEALLSDARRRTRIDLTMGLRGSLLSPLITFNLSSPELVGELKTYMDNKFQSLRNDPDQLNQQVFGLVVLGGFIPSNAETDPFTSIGASTINTLSEFLSSQLSLFVSSLLNNVVDDVKFISGIDVDLAYVQQIDLEGQNSTDFRDGEYQFRFRNRLWNDQWVITVGGNYGAQSVISADPYFNPETVIEWNTPVRGLKLRLYYKAEQSFQGQRQKLGGGLRYRKEFDSFDEFMNAARQNAKPEGR